MCRNLNCGGERIAWMREKQGEDKSKLNRSEGGCTDSKRYLISIIDSITSEEAELVERFLKRVKMKDDGR